METQWDCFANDEVNISPVEIILTGSVMKNIGICEKLRQELTPKKINRPDEPQIAGALGACQTLPFRRAAIIANKHVAVQTN